MTEPPVELSLVVPMYNEERSIDAFLAATLPVLDALTSSYEVIFINDGSADRSAEIVTAHCAQNPKIKLVDFARNFGKEVALAAGLAHASGAAVIPIDCDLQHPPQLIHDMYREWKAGARMVVAVRKKREEEGFVRRKVSQGFYRVLSAMTSVEIPPNAGDYRLLDRAVVDVLNRMPERSRFMKGMFSWPGFKRTEVYFEAAERFAGASTFNYWRLWNLALDGIFSFSSVPLRIWTYVGLVTALGSFAYFLWTVVKTLILGVDVPGFASLLSLLLLFNGLQLISNGVQGEYIARIFDEVKRRPLYVVNRTVGFSEPTRHVPALTEPPSRL
jgi:glycosyltransferase involved in cell wall biosynthesis